MNKSFFIHIPKTAGQSIKRNMRNAKYGHVSFRMMPDTYRDDDAYVFSFVRNPFDRLVSVFFYDAGDYRYYDDLETARNEFAEWVDTIDVTDHKGNTERNKGLIPQWWWLVNRGGRLPDKIDFIGKFENLDKDYLRVAEEINIPLKLGREKVNKTNHEHYLFYYTPELKEKVHKMYKKDFDWFYNEEGGVLPI